VAKAGTARSGRASRQLELAVAVPAGRGLGFRLAGVPVVEVAPGEEAAALAALRAQPALGVLVVEASLLVAEPPGGRRRDGALPVVVPFALPRRWSDAGGGRAFIAALVRRAVGYHVKLGGRP
jgi:V/A-type H+/Na+-transporting ATPase subunit F